MVSPISVAVVDHIKDCADKVGLIYEVGLAVGGDIRLVIRKVKPAGNKQIKIYYDHLEPPVEMQTNDSRAILHLRVVGIGGDTQDFMYDDPELFAKVERFINAWFHVGIAL